MRRALGWRGITGWKPMPLVGQGITRWKPMPLGAAGVLCYKASQAVTLLDCKLDTLVEMNA